MSSISGGKLLPNGIDNYFVLFVFIWLGMSHPGVTRLWMCRRWCCSDKYRDQAPSMSTSGCKKVLQGYFISGNIGCHHAVACKWPIFLTGCGGPDDCLTRRRDSLLNGTDQLIFILCLPGGAPPYLYRAQTARQKISYFAHSDLYLRSAVFNLH